MSEARPEFGGMTANERLNVAGLLERFDSAINSGDRHQAIDLLVEVAVTEDRAAETVDTVFDPPCELDAHRPWDQPIQGATRIG